MSAAAPVPESVRQKADRGAALASAGAAAAAAASKFVAAASLAASQQGGDTSNPSISNVSLVPITARSKVPPVRLSIPNSLNGAQTGDSFNPPRLSNSSSQGSPNGAQDEDALSPPRMNNPSSPSSLNGTQAEDVLRPSASNTSLPSRPKVSPARLSNLGSPLSAQAFLQNCSNNGNTAVSPVFSSPAGSTGNSEGPEASPPGTVPRARCAVSPSSGAGSPPRPPPPQGPADGVWLKLIGNDRHEEQLVISSGQLQWPHGAISPVQVLAHDTIRVIMDNGMSFEGRLTDGARMLLWDNGSCWTRKPKKGPRGGLGGPMIQSPLLGQLPMTSVPPPGVYSPAPAVPRPDGSESPPPGAMPPCGTPSASHPCGSPRRVVHPPCGSPQCRGPCGSPCGSPRPAPSPRRLEPSLRPMGGSLGAPSSRRSLPARVPQSVLMNCRAPGDGDCLPESSFITADGGQYVWPEGVVTECSPMDSPQSARLRGACGSNLAGPPPSSSVAIPASPSVSSVSLASPPAQPMRPLHDYYGGSS